MADQKITTPGALLIRRMLPTESARKNFDIHDPLTKKGVNKLVVNLLKNGGHESYETINKLAQLFFNTATEHGYTTPVDDYINDSEERKALLKEFDIKVSQLMNDKSLGHDEKMNKISDVAADYQSKFEKQNIHYMVGRGSTAAKMALTGARGNPGQLQQGTSTPVMGSGINGIVPYVIHHSFAEGMTPAEQLALSYGGRSNTIQAQTATSQPGALFKKMAPTTFGEVITIDDCKTTNGVKVPINDSAAIIGRYIAGSNKLVDEAYYDELKASTKYVRVRSPLTCEAKEGICKKCYGLAANGRLPDIGENVGVIAAQSAAENLTQAVLSTKHTGGTAGKKRNTYAVVNNLLMNPENFQDEASISRLNGTVGHIQKTALNDNEVYVVDKKTGLQTKHFIPRQQDVLVKIGDNVKIGQRLSTGQINPRTVAELKGLGSARHVLANSLREAYGSDLDPRHFDLLAKNLVKYVEVHDPGESNFVPGEKVDIKDITQYLHHNSYEANLNDAKGKVLAKSAGQFTPGTILTQNHLDELKEDGIGSVHVSDTGLRINALVPGLGTGKQFDNNWISRLAFNKLRDTVADAGARGLTSQVHSTDPITSYVLGNSFGEGENGRY